MDNGVDEHCDGDVECLKYIRHSRDNKHLSIVEDYCIEKSLHIPSMYRYIAIILICEKIRLFIRHEMGHCY